MLEKLAAVLKKHRNIVISPVNLKQKITFLSAKEFMEFIGIRDVQALSSIMKEAVNMEFSVFKGHIVKDDPEFWTWITKESEAFVRHYKISDIQNVIPSVFGKSYIVVKAEAMMKERGYSPEQFLAEIKNCNDNSELANKIGLPVKIVEQYTAQGLRSSFYDLKYGTMNNEQLLESIKQRIENVKIDKCTGLKRYLEKRWGNDWREILKGNKKLPDDSNFPAGEKFEKHQTSNLQSFTNQDLIQLSNNKSLDEIICEFETDLATFLTLFKKRVREPYGHFLLDRLSTHEEILKKYDEVDGSLEKFCSHYHLTAEELKSYLKRRFFAKDTSEGIKTARSNIRSHISIEDMISAIRNDTEVSSTKLMAQVDPALLKARVLASDNAETLAIELGVSKSVFSTNLQKIFGMNYTEMKVASQIRDNDHLIQLINDSESLPSLAESLKVLPDPLARYIIKRLEKTYVEVKVENQAPTDENLVVLLKSGESRKTLAQNLKITPRQFRDFLKERSGKTHTEMKLEDLTNEELVNLIHMSENLASLAVELKVIVSDLGRNIIKRLGKTYTEVKIEYSIPDNDQMLARVNSSESLRSLAQELNVNPKECGNVIKNRLGKTYTEIKLATLSDEELLNLIHMSENIRSLAKTFKLGPKILGWCIFKRLGISYTEIKLEKLSDEELLSLIKGSKDLISLAKQLDVRWKHLNMMFVKRFNRNYSEIRLEAKIADDVQLINLILSSKTIQSLAQDLAVGFNQLDQFIVKRLSRGYRDVKIDSMFDSLVKLAQRASSESNFLDKLGKKTGNWRVKLKRYFFLRFGNDWFAQLAAGKLSKSINNKRIAEHSIEEKTPKRAKHWRARATNDTETPASFSIAQTLLSLDAEPKILEEENTLIIKPPLQIPRQDSVEELMENLDFTFLANLPVESNEHFPNPSQFDKEVELDTISVSEDEEMEIDTIPMPEAKEMELDTIPMPAAKEMEADTIPMSENYENEEPTSQHARPAATKTFSPGAFRHTFFKPSENRSLPEEEILDDDFNMEQYVPYPRDQMRNV